MTFGSVQAAIAYVGERLDIPVMLPTYLPGGVTFERRVTVTMESRGTMRSAQMTLTMGRRRPLIIQFGLSLLDGCAPEDSVVTHVGRQDALIRAAPEWVELIWPATHGTPQGTYGLSGSLSSAQMLLMAASMPHATARPPVDIGC